MFLGQDGEKEELQINTNLSSHVTVILKTGSCNLVGNEEKVPTAGGWGWRSDLGSLKPKTNVHCESQLQPCTKHFKTSPRIKHFHVFTYVYCIIILLLLL